MKNVSKKFLVPLAVAIAGLATTTSSEASISSTAPAVSDVQEKLSPITNSTLKKDDKRVIFSQGNELHSLILNRDNQGVVLADHESHYSHRSHSSHRSHYSGY
jgi:hypothetical protein